MRHWPLLLCLLALTTFGVDRPTHASSVTLPLAPGWQLIAGPTGSRVSGAVGPLYTWPLGAQAYQAVDAGAPLQGGVGYWAFMAEAGTLSLGTDQPAATAGLLPGGWQLIGNPFLSDAPLQGSGAVLTYTPTAGYQPQHMLAAGQGAWAWTPTVLSLAASDAPSSYPLHQEITATVFWVGEPQGNGSSENNAVSAFDDDWLAHYGGVDDYQHRSGYLPVGFVPQENPFYLDLPYSDFNDQSQRRADVTQVPWYDPTQLRPGHSLVKNRWVRIMHGGVTCYGQWEDAGPYLYDDVAYVFGMARPTNRQAQQAGMDVSPALRDCLGFAGLNTADNHVAWQFVAASAVPAGPWSQTITTSEVNQH
ncbi:MAG: hypothetical protein ACYDCQ_02595 [Dehalococcoidia bacterium]